MILFLTFVLHFLFLTGGAVLSCDRIEVCLNVFERELLMENQAVKIRVHAIFIGAHKGEEFWENLGAVAALDSDLLRKHKL